MNAAAVISAAVGDRANTRASPHLPFSTQWAATTTRCGIRDSLPAERTASSREANMAAPHYQHTHTTQRSPAIRAILQRTHARWGKSKRAAERGSQGAAALSPKHAHRCCEAPRAPRRASRLSRLRPRELSVRKKNVRSTTSQSVRATTTSVFRCACRPKQFADRHALHAAPDHNSELRLPPTYPAE